MRCDISVFFQLPLNVKYEWNGPSLRITGNRAMDESSIFEQIPHSNTQPHNFAVVRIS
jgi:hypothetical protein